MTEEQKPPVTGVYPSGPVAYPINATSYPSQSWITDPYEGVKSIEIKSIEIKSIESVLEERGTRYGSFDTHAKVTQEIKNALVHGASYSKLNDAMTESLEMIAHKMGRIVNGDPYYKDSWTDIIGYAKLVEQELKD